MELMEDKWLKYLFYNFLEGPDLARAAQVCSKWCKITKDEALWELVQQREFGGCKPVYFKAIRIYLRE
jgi:hypothetical protein